MKENENYYADNEDCKRSYGAINPDALYESFGNVLTSMYLYDIPPFETVRRARQKIQAKCPELAGSKEVRKARKELEREMRKFAGER